MKYAILDKFDLLFHYTSLFVTIRDYNIYSHTCTYMQHCFEKCALICEIANAITIDLKSLSHDSIYFYVQNIMRIHIRIFV